VRDAPSSIKKTVFNTEPQITKPKLKKGRMRSQADHTVEVKLIVRANGIIFPFPFDPKGIGNRMRRRR
jgi:hypothetical protein